MAYTYSTASMCASVCNEYNKYLMLLCRYPITYSMQDIRIHIRMYVCMVNKLGGSRVSLILFFILFITFLSLSIYCFLAVFSFFWSVTRSFIVFMPYNNWRSPTGKSESFFCYHHIMSTITLTYISKERIILYLICWMTIMSLRQSVSFILMCMTWLCIGANSIRRIRMFCLCGYFCSRSSAILCTIQS